ncbi:MAG: IS1 family transposase [Stellaceae bacterium]
MNVLPRDQQIAVISALTEGCSIRATERLTGIHRDTIMRLGARIGASCADLHDAIMRNIQVPRIELDEVWGFVGKKQKRVKQTDGTGVGDQYTFIALAGSAKAIVSYRTGKRTAENTRAFLADLRERVIGAPEISSDAFQPYPVAVEMAFGIDCKYGQIEKHYAVDGAVEAKRRYSPGEVVSVSTRGVIGNPLHISTSYVERQNLSLRMAQRRFTRLSNGFSKKLDNHAAAVSLYVAHYNLCRVHEALRITPAMHLGVTDHIWTIGELIDATESPKQPAPPIAPFTVIQGGRS